MSEVVLTVEAFTDRNLKSPEEMVLTLQRNVDLMLALPDVEQNRFLVNYMIRLARVVAGSAGTDVGEVVFWSSAMSIQQKKEDRRNGLAQG